MRAAATSGNYFRSDTGGSPSFSQGFCHMILNAPRVPPPGDGDKEDDDDDDDDDREDDDENHDANDVDDRFVSYE